MKNLSNSPAFSSLVRVLILCLSIAAMVSCGGGGGGGGGPELLYITDWTNRGRAVTGLSQRIQVFDNQDRLKKSVLMNQDSTTLQQVNLTEIGSGTVRVFVELFSQRNLAGVRTGVIESLVNLNSSATFRSTVGEDPTSVRVTPDSATFEAGRGRQFYAAGFIGDRAAFIEADSVTWQTLGGTASVTESGFVQGESEGPGTVRATHTTSGLQGSGVFTVTAPQTTTSKWTIMVFLNAANDLYPFSTLNVNQMESVAQNEDVRFVLQWKQSKSLFSNSTFDGTRRYLVRPDTTDSIASDLLQDLGDEVDMGNPDYLHDFVQWAKTYYPAERYCLVIWNHGNGWRRGQEDMPSRAVSYDDETGNAIQIWEMSQALGSNLFDIVAFDASLMQMVEVAVEIKDRAKYVVGSEESPPGEGYPYQLIFDNFRDNPDDSTLNLSKAFVDGMLAVPAYASRKITQSVIDTTKLGALETALDTLAGALIDNVGSIGTPIQNIRTAAQSYSPTTFRVFRDIDHLCQLIASNIGIVAVQNAANSVRTALAEAVVWEGHNSNSSGSRGLSIDFSAAAQFTFSADDYALMRFANGTRWNEWLEVAP